MICTNKLHSFIRLHSFVQLPWSLSLLACSVAQATALLIFITRRFCGNFCKIAFCVFVRHGPLKTSKYINSEILCEICTCNNKLQSLHNQTPYRSNRARAISEPSAPWSMPLQRGTQQLERFQRRAARFVKIDYRYTTSVTGLLDELGWLPLFERRKHSRLNNLSAFSLDHLSVSSRHTKASNENKFVLLPVRTNVFKYSFFLGPLPIGTPSHWLFVSCSQLSPSTGLFRTRHPPTVSDIMTLRR